MKKKAIVAILVTLVTIGITVAIMSPSGRTGSVEVLCTLNDSSFGSVYVVGRPNGLLEGWDIAFFHRTLEGQWLGYYIAHESWGWKGVILQLHTNVMVIKNHGKTIAEYDIQNSIFTNKLQGVVYLRRDGIEGGVEASKWNIQKGVNP